MLQEGEEKASQPRGTIPTAPQPNPSQPRGLTRAGPRPQPLTRTCTLTLALALIFIDRKRQMVSSSFPFRLIRLQPD